MTIVSWPLRARVCHAQIRRPAILRQRIAYQRCMSSSDASRHPSPENSISTSAPQGKSAETARQSLPSKVIEAAATAFASIIVLGTGFALGGFIYHRYYKWLVLQKMENAFNPGDPVLELAAMGKQVKANIPSSKPLGDDEHHWIVRDEQSAIDAIVNGTEHGHYHLIIGEKGTGKSSMLLDAMHKIDGEGVSMFDCHADLEIFRIRLGKALDFEYNEDYIGSYFSERGPRDTTALLDIERAFNKLEKVALRRRAIVGRPLILIINSMHLLRDDEDGRDLLELLQQRAEQWSASNLVTLVFVSDDFWVFERLKQLATRMEVTAIGDLPRSQALDAMRKYRMKFFKEEPSSEVLSQVYDKIGGRLTFLNRVAKARDMLKACDDIYNAEKQWFLNNCWVFGATMDDDMMAQQKYASAAMVLALALVDLEAEMGAPSMVSSDGHKLPSIPLHKAREIMTRGDFIRPYDQINLFTITPGAMVRADSVAMQRVFRDICSQPGFREHLQATLGRLDDIESLERTREYVAKDLVLGGKYVFSMRRGGGAEVELVVQRDKSE